MGFFPRSQQFDYQEIKSILLQGRAGFAYAYWPDRDLAESQYTPSNVDVDFSQGKVTGYMTRMPRCVTLQIEEMW